MNRAAVFLALIGAWAPMASSASWNPDGNPVVVAPASQDRFAAIPFGSGGILVAWVDQRNDAGDIYAMALDASGDPVAGWPSGGAPVCTAPGEQSFVALIADGAGGAYLRWIDRRAASAHALQRITSTGTVAAGWPNDGLIFATELAESRPYALASDGEEGVYVAWTAGLRGRVARYDGSAVITAGWPMELPTRDASPSSFDMIADGSGGLVALGTDASTAQMHAYRFDGSGGVSPGWPASGVPLFPATFVGPHLVPGIADDFFATRINDPPLCPCCEATSFLARRVELDGVVDPTWPESGELGGQIGEVVADGAGGIMSVGSSRYGCTDVARAAALRLEADRMHPWGPGTRPVCDQVADQQAPSIADDGSGGAYIGWIDKRDNGVPVLYATRLDAVGEFAAGWPASGSMEAPGALAPSAPRVIATQSGRAVEIWVDRRNGTPDIYAKQMVPGPAGPPFDVGVEPGTTTFGISWIGPNPSPGCTRVMIELAGASSARLEVVDLGGRVRERRTLAGGRNTVTLNATGAMQPGVYWLRVTQEGNVGTRRFVIAR